MFFLQPENPADLASKFASIVVHRPLLSPAKFAPLCWQQEQQLAGWRLFTRGWGWAELVLSLQTTHKYARIWTSFYSAYARDIFYVCKAPIRRIEWLGKFL